MTFSSSQRRHPFSSEGIDTASLWEVSGPIQGSLNFTGLLRPQWKHARGLLDSILMNGWASDFSTTGCGKTYCAAWVAKHVNAPTYIVSPKAVIPSWNKVLTAFGIKAVVINYEKLVRGNTKWVKRKMVKDPRNHNSKQANDDVKMLRWKLPANALIILDESHKCKGYASLNSELLLSAKDQGHRFLTVSATQAFSPLDMFVYGWVIGQHKFYDYHDWCTTQFGAEWTKKGYFMVCDMTTDKAMKGMAELHAKLIEMKAMQRLTLKDMGGYFPSNHVIPEVLDMGGNGAKIAKAYDEMEREIAVLEEKGYSEHIFAVIMKARRQAEILKVPTIEEKVIDLVEEGKSVTVFLNFTDTLESLARRLEKNKSIKEGDIVYIRGGQSADAREKAIAAFQANKAKIILCNIGAGGVGVSLHDLEGGHERVSIITLPQQPAQFVQALGRIHRADGKSPCVQYVIFCAGTIEERIAAKLKMKIGNLEALTEGDVSISHMEKYGMNYALPAYDMEEAAA
jgi:superfamily II DNA or RNA helicase